MGIINIILLIIQYGPAIAKAVKAAIELIRWLRENDKEATYLVDAKAEEMRIKEIAKLCKYKKDPTDLQEYVAKLAARKAEVLAKKGA